jgi:hypothetical protein
VTGSGPNGDSWRWLWRGSMVLLVGLLSWEGQRVVTSQDSIWSKLQRHDGLLQQLLDKVDDLTSQMTTRSTARDVQIKAMVDIQQILMKDDATQGESITDIKTRLDAQDSKIFEYWNDVAACRAACAAKSSR